MTYRCGIGLGLPLPPQHPHFSCDGGCGAVYRIQGRGAGGNIAPEWFLDGKAPRGWTKVKITDDVSRHFCPKCRHQAT